MESRSDIGHKNTSVAGLQFISDPITLVPIYVVNGNNSAQTVLYNSVNSAILGGAVLGILCGLLLYLFYQVHIKWSLRSSEFAL